MGDDVLEVQVQEQDWPTLLTTRLQIHFHTLKSCGFLCSNFCSHVGFKFRLTPQLGLHKTFCLFMTTAVPAWMIDTDFRSPAGGSHHRRTAWRQHRDIFPCPESPFGLPWTASLTTDNKASRNELTSLSDPRISHDYLPGEMDVKKKRKGRTETLLQTQLRQSKTLA